VLSLSLVIGAALIDSTNPCGLSVLIFLLVTIASAGGRRRILLIGGSYIAAMFLFHLLVGMGLFSLFSLSGYAKLFSIIGGALAIVLGAVTIADVLRGRDTFLLSIPESKKGMLGMYARKASLPAAFILGVLAGILGFTCTGGIYISILGLMGKDMTVMTGLPWLILYNLVYIFPLVVITLLIAFGLSPERAELLQGKYKRQVRLLIGIILLALGAIILLGWVG
jgi:cytochrome c biogenesis protein CcdA